MKLPWQKSELERVSKMFEQAVILAMNGEINPSLKQIEKTLDLLGIKYERQRPNEIRLAYFERMRVLANNTLNYFLERSHD
jgi:hypothetical protein